MKERTRRILIINTINKIKVNNDEIDNKNINKNK